MLNPDVSVVTVFFNRANLIDESVGSLLRQTAANMEIVVVDDGSTDDTLERLNAMRDSRLKIVALSNGGFTRAVKAGVAASHAPLVAIHGSGDISHPDRIHLQANFLRQHSDVGIVGCAYDHNGRLIHSSITAEPEIGEIWDRFKTGNPFSHGEVMFRRSIYDQVGGYDERFAYGQDYDLWLRMAPFCKYAILREVLYTKVDPANSVRRNTKKYYTQQKLAHLSHQRTEALMMGHPDDLGKDVEQSAFALTGSKKYARRFFNKGVEALSVSDFEGASFIFAKAWLERRDLRGLLAIMMSLILRLRLGQLTLKQLHFYKRRLAALKR